MIMNQLDNLLQEKHSMEYNYHKPNKHLVVDYIMKMIINRKQILCFRQYY